MADSWSSAGRAALLRETTKWSAVAFLGAGTILFSGLAYPNLAKAAESSSWWTVLGLALVPLAAAGAVVGVTFRVATVRGVDITRLLPRYAAALGIVVDTATPTGVPDTDSALLPTAVAVHGGIDSFDQELTAARQAAEDAADRHARDPTAGRRAELDQARSRLDELRAGVVELADYSDYTAVYRAVRSARWVLAGAAIVAVAGVAGAGVVGGRTTRTTEPPTAPFDAATRVTVWAPPERTLPPAAGGPARCPVADGASAVAVGGNYEAPVLHFAAADPRLLAGMAPDVRARCAHPWSWSPQPGEVLVLPAPTRP